jgi:hypothetical protein
MTTTTTMTTSTTEIIDEAPEEIKTDTDSKRKRRRRRKSATPKIVTVINVDEDTETVTTIHASPHPHTPPPTSPPVLPHLEVPVIICGDFNISPSSGIYSFITSPEGQVDFSKMSMKQLGARCEEDRYLKYAYLQITSPCLLFSF